VNSNKEKKTQQQGRKAFSSSIREQARQKKRGVNGTMHDEV